MCMSEHVDDIKATVNDEAGTSSKKDESASDTDDNTITEQVKTPQNNPKKRKNKKRNKKAAKKRAVSYFPQRAANHIPQRPVDHHPQRVNNNDRRQRNMQVVISEEDLVDLIIYKHIFEQVVLYSFLNSLF